MRLNRRHFLAATGTLAVQALLTACGGQAVTTPAASTAPATAVPSTAASATRAAGSSPATTPTRAAASPSAATIATPRLNTSAKLTLYNAQHENLVKGMVEGFTKETGVQVDVRSGKDFDLANQIVQEGASSPADAFITENSPAMQVVAAKGLFAPIDKATLAQVPARFVPSSGDWMGVAGRSTVFVYNPKLLATSALPGSIMDLSGSTWKDKVGIAPSGADFQAVVSAVVALKGADAGLTWLKGLKANAKVYSGNGAILRAVNAGEIPGGIIYHYYWYQDRADSGANSNNTELHFFQNKDAGGFFSISGLGALKSSKNPNEAQALLRYMTGKAGQQVLANGTFSLEYTLNPEVTNNPKLKPFSELSIPDVDLARLNGTQVIDLMQQAGLL
jgi:iron(III) transport system substrate-binding protein